MQTTTPDLNARNDYGVPLHACNGYRMDEHYWALIKHVRESGQSFVAWSMKAREHFQKETHDA